MGAAKKGFSIGVDFGTNSVRAVVVSVETGREAGSCVYNYRGGADGIIVSEKDPNLARQDPREYFTGLSESVRGAVSASGAGADEIRGIGVDTTGSTPIPVDAEGSPLSFKPGFRDNPNAMAWLWKDHTAFGEAEEITEKARLYDPDYTRFSGGEYSSEWFFAKILRLARTDRPVYEAAASFVEHCDLMPAVLSGAARPEAIMRSVCAAGHKAMYNPSWGGLPSDEFLRSVDPLLGGLRSKLYNRAFTADKPVGSLSREWADNLSLAAGIPVSGGAFDAHMGAVGAGISPGKLVKIMGTSTCDMAVSRPGALSESIKGVCGQVDGSIVPGFIGIEAGQSAVGDIFGWFRDFLLWPLKNLFPGHAAGGGEEVNLKARDGCFVLLTEKALKIKPGESGLLALDWFNGNRNLLFDADLTGLIAGLTLGAKPEEVYLALIEGTAFGARVILERLEEYGVKVDELTACGGLAVKSPLIMQVYSNILNVPISVSSSEQACALGAAIFGACAGKVYDDVPQAQEAMSASVDRVYKPEGEAVKIYEKIYPLYVKLHDSFGMGSAGGDMRMVIKELLKIKRKVRNNP